VVDAVGLTAATSMTAAGPDRSRPGQPRFTMKLVTALAPPGPATPTR
jgi:hypothetical protein